MSRNGDGIPLSRITRNNSLPQTPCCGISIFLLLSAFTNYNLTVAKLAELRVAWSTLPCPLTLASYLAKRNDRPPLLTYRDHDQNMYTRPRKQIRSERFARACSDVPDTISCVLLGTVTVARKEDAHGRS